MAKNVTVVTLGQSPSTSDRTASTVGELASELELGTNLQVKINGETATYDSEVEDFAFISFGEKIKGGKRRCPSKSPLLTDYLTVAVALNA